jgi:hypothetical protein
MCSCLPLILFLKAIGVTSSVPETVVRNCRPRNCLSPKLSGENPFSVTSDSHSRYLYIQTDGVTSKASHGVTPSFPFPSSVSLGIYLACPV